MSTLKTFRYAVVQFHRNPVRGEPVNVGLAMMAPPTVLVRFESNLGSLLRLKPPEAGLVEACLRQITNDITRDPQTWTLERLQRTYRHSIAFSEVRGGLTEKLSDEFGDLFRELVAHDADYALTTTASS